MTQRDTGKRISTHSTVDDLRNKSVKVYVNGEMLPRDQAKISVFDSGFLVGDGVWEGLRLFNDRFIFEELHIERLFEGAKAIAGRVRP